MWEVCQLISFHIQYLEGRQLSYILRKGRQLIIMKIQNLDGYETQEAAGLRKQGGEVIRVDNEHLFL